MKERTAANAVMGATEDNSQRPTSNAQSSFVSFVVRFGYWEFLYKKTPGLGKSGRAKKAKKRNYEARAARRCGTTGTTATFTGLVTFARAVARARFFAFTMKHRSSALSTRLST